VQGPPPRLEDRTVALVAGADRDRLQERVDAWHVNSRPCDGLDDLANAPDDVLDAVLVDVGGFDRDTVRAIADRLEPASVPTVAIGTERDALNLLARAHRLARPFQPMELRTAFQAALRDEEHPPSRPSNETCSSPTTAKPREASPTA